MSLLIAQNLAIRFGGIRAVDDVSFAVPKASVFTLIGPNGAGKTTVFNLISRIFDPSSGQIAFDGHDITGVPAHRIAGLGIARTFQNIELFENASVLQNLLLGRHSWRSSNLLAEMLFLPSVRRLERSHREQVEHVIEFLDLHSHRDSLVGGLPYGVRKVVELGRALCCKPRLLLLDEPSSGLNPEETDDMAFWIKDIRDRLGTAILMVEHDMTLVNKVSDRVLALSNGRVLAEGSAAEVQAHPDVIKAYLGGE